VAEICTKCGARVATRVATELAGDISPKSRLTATLLAFFLGAFGAHRFYIGKTGTAIVMLVLGIVGLATTWIFVGIVFLTAVGIWALVDFIFAVVGHMRDKEGRLIQKW
jgi:TM2 domain-containing membrane protein YozV